MCEALQSMQVRAVPDLMSVKSFGGGVDTEESREQGR